MQTIRITITSPAEANVVLKQNKVKSNDITEKIRNLLVSNSSKKE